MIKSAFGRYWRGKFYAKGDPMPEATQAQAEAMVACGQAYIEDDRPTDDSLKSEIQQYLQARGIDFNKSDTKNELLEKLNDSERNG